MPKEREADGGSWAAIARYMKEHRTRLGWTQRFAAKKAEISADTWNALERGRKDRVKEITLVRIATGLGREPEELLEIVAGGNGGTED